MTLESAIAKDVALQFEGKLDSVRRNQDGTIKMTLNVAITDFPQQLMTDPLGQRYVCVMVAINEDESPRIAAPLASAAAKQPEDSMPPVATSKRWEDLPYPQRAGMLCADTNFQKWLEISHGLMGIMTSWSPEDLAARWLRGKCSIGSRSELKTNPEAQRTFEAICTSFDVWERHGDIESR